MHRRVAFSLALILSLSVAAAWADDKNLGEKEIKALIEKLASPNETPKLDGQDAVYPPTYDRQAQIKVERAWQSLYELGLSTFPYLFQSIADKRYSYTRDGGAADVNLSVGDQCRAILKSYLQPYGHQFTAGVSDPRFVPHRPSYFRNYDLDNPKSAAKWWESRKEKSLRELQIETLEWVIAEEAKRPKDYIDKEREYLSDVLKKLKNGKEPLPPKWPFVK